MSSNHEESPPLININAPDFVNRYGPEADAIENNPDKMLALVDLIFGFTDSKLPPS